MGWTMPTKSWCGRQIRKTRTTTKPTSGLYLAVALIRLPSMINSLMKSILGTMTYRSLFNHHKSLAFDGWSIEMHGGGLVADKVGIGKVRSLTWHN